MMSEHAIYMKNTDDVQVMLQDAIYMRSTDDI